jgi:ketosteroid isomerase-like protein
MKSCLHNRLLIWFITLSVPAFAQSDDEVIRSSRLKSNEAIAKHDTAAMAVYWLEDVNVLTSRSIELRGKIANERAFQQEFQIKERLLYVRSTNTIEIFSNWNMAAEHGRWTGTWMANGSSIRITGSYYAKWHKMDGAWKIKAEVYTPLSCEGGDYCKSLK